MKRLTILDGYRAAAPNGLGGVDDYIDVDAVPDTTTSVTRDQIQVPVVLLNAAGDTVLKRLMVTGWTDTPSPVLYIDPTYGSDITDPCVIVCAPSSIVHDTLQTAQSMSVSLGGGGTLKISPGLKYDVNVTAAGVIEIEAISIPSVTPDSQQLENLGHVTRLVLTDQDADQPAITWDIPYYDIVWESGAAQFQVGKPRMLVEFVYAGSKMLGSVKHFA